MEVTASGAGLSDAGRGVHVDMSACERGAGQEWHSGKK